MKITICIGSSCHIKGSHEVVTRLQELVSEKELEDRIELSGAFCMNNCRDGVCVTVDGKLFSVSPETVESFFENTVIKRLGL